MTLTSNVITVRGPDIRPFFLSMENPQLGWGFRKAFSFKSVIKTPFDLLK
ncbi:hypothetical protein AU726_003150, partial [Salmonella enterica subsp. enterica]|nr:hypothetical protein [Salmonella enterica subsp. enterica]